MQRQPTQSSNIASIGYDPVSKQLEVEFKNGSIFAYEGVPAEFADQFVKAESVGRFFAQNVRKAFPGKRVNP